MEEKILSILGELLKGQEELKGDVQALKTGQEALKSEVTQIKLTLENETNVKIRALFDAREVQKSVNEQIFTELRYIKSKLDRLQLETAHVRIVK